MASSANSRSVASSWRQARNASRSPLLRAGASRVVLPEDESTGRASAPFLLSRAPDTGTHHRQGWTSHSRIQRRETEGTSVSYTHLRAHETRHELVCRLLLEKKKRQVTIN